MTLEKFCEKYSVSKRTAEKWIENKLIPGVRIKDGKLSIPKSAMPPYTKARAKNAESIYASFVHACMLRHHILPKLYKGMSTNRFKAYVDNAISYGLISPYQEDGITYYIETPAGIEYYNKKPNERRQFIIELAKEVAEASARGAVSAMINPA